MHQVVYMIRLHIHTSKHPCKFRNNISKLSDLQLGPGGSFMEDSLMGQLGKVVTYLGKYYILEAVYTFLRLFTAYAY
jgi:hypothetical protein